MVESFTCAPARPLPVQARSRARVERVLDATTALIEAHGVDAVAISDIAARSGVTPASIYRYFPDKIAIIATLAERHSAHSRACVEAGFDTVRSPDDLVPAAQAMLLGYQGVFDHVPGARAIWQATQADPRLQALDSDEVEAHARTIARAVSRALPQVDADEALAMGRLVTGIVGAAVRGAAALPPEEGLHLITLCRDVVLPPTLTQFVARVR